MRHRIRRIGVLKAALVGGIFYAIIGLIVFVPFFFFATMIGSMGGGYGTPADWMFAPAFALLAPVFYGVGGFIGGAIGAAVYNLIAMMVGGLEVELEPLGDG